MSSELDDLIKQAAEERFDDSAGATSIEAPVDKPALLNHPWAALFAWLFCASIITYQLLEPLPKQHDLGVRSNDTRLGIAVYHVAHNVESYRQQTGHLPDFLMDGWQESDAVTYELRDDGYVITGRTGELEIIFREGDDSQRLIHSIDRQEGRN